MQLGRSLAPPLSVVSSVRDHSLWKEFSSFLLRGNVIDLAVAVIIGASFGGVVDAIVKDLMTPLIAAVGGQPDFSGIAFTLNGSQFAVGHLINALVSFLIIAGVIFFFVLKPTNVMVERVRKQERANPTTKTCPECLSDVKLAAKRCAFCTSLLVENVESAQAA